MKRLILAAAMCAGSAGAQEINMPPEAIEFAVVTRWLASEATCQEAITAVNSVNGGTLREAAAGVAILGFMNGYAAGKGLTPGSLTGEWLIRCATQLDARFIDVMLE